MTYAWLTCTQELGADEAYDYREDPTGERFKDRPFDVVFDNVLGALHVTCCYAYVEQC